MNTLYYGINIYKRFDFYYFHIIAGNSIENINLFIKIKHLWQEVNKHFIYKIFMNNLCSGKDIYKAYIYLIFMFQCLLFFI